MQPLEILSIILITLIFFTFLYLLLSVIIVQKHNDHPQTPINDFLTPYEKQQAIDQFRNNYGWLSPEAQQKIMKGKYVSPQALERDLEFYNQDEYIGKFEGRK